MSKKHHKKRRKTLEKHQMPKARPERDDGIHHISDPIKSLLRSPFIITDEPIQNLDRRFYRPEIDKVPRKIDGRPSPVRIKQKVYDPKAEKFRPVKRPLEAPLEFSDKLHTVVCRQRKKRRETLFRRRKIGKGKGVSPKRIFTELSKIICK